MTICSGIEKYATEIIKSSTRKFILLFAYSEPDRLVSMSFCLLFCFRFSSSTSWLGLVCEQQAKCGISAHFLLLGAIVGVFGTSSHDEEGEIKVIMAIVLTCL